MTLAQLQSLVDVHMSIHGDRARTERRVSKNPAADLAQLGVL